jgi:hypothetical protein
MATTAARTSRAGAAGPSRRRARPARTVLAGPALLASTRAARTLPPAGPGRRITALPPAPDRSRRTKGRYQHASGPQHEDVRRHRTAGRTTPEVDHLVGSDHELAQDALEGRRPSEK